MIVLYILLGLFWLFFPTSSRHVQETPIQLEQIVQKHCLDESVSCIDTCDFLCLEPHAKCLGGKCLVSDTPIDCQTRTGGMVVLTEKHGFLHWTCYCTDSTFYGGPNCSEKVPDVCNHGIFIYKDVNRYRCICNYPYVKVEVNGKPHCLEPSMRGFFPTDE